MKPLLRDVVVFLALQAAILVALEVHYRRSHQGAFLLAFEDKAELLERTPSPRVVLVGGSGMAFGVNSSALARATGRPVVNLGLYAGLGLDIMLAQSERAARAGDLLILSPEYEVLDRQPLSAPSVYTLILESPSVSRFVAVDTLPQLLDEGLSVGTIRIRALGSIFDPPAPPEKYYHRSAFDGNGDVVAHEHFASRAGGGQHVRIPEAVDMSPTVRRLAAFGRAIRARGAHVVLVPAAIPADDVATQSARFDALWTRFAREGGIAVRGLKKRYPRDLFFDTPYHLTLDGKRLRTRGLAQIAGRALSETEPDPPRSRVALARDEQP